MTEGSLAWAALAAGFGDRLAVTDPAGEHSYRDLLVSSARVGATLLDGERDLDERRVAFLVSPSYDWVAVAWGIWRAGGIAVPLCTSHPPPELEYVLEDSDADLVVVEPGLRDRLEEIVGRRGLRLLATDSLLAGADAEEPESGALPEVAIDRRAMIVYTSGSTGKPKGAVTTHANLESQMDCLIEAWQWSPEDRILEVLPLHHVHGIVNVVSCALRSGAVCEMLPKFEAGAVWEAIASGRLTLFMAVPTIYVRLIAAWDEASAAQQEAWSRAARRLRLMVSGSAALPVSVLDRFEEITGHRLLERYGMTETGMILSNPYAGERRPGFVGQPLPGVEVQLRGENGELSAVQGEVEVRGPAVFREYWRRPEATEAAFRDGWFLTGDVAVHEEGSYRLLGRQSVDILKTGGYKISALEIEEVLRQHPDVVECAVVGVPDDEWGERVGAAIVWRGGDEVELDDLRAWAKERLAPYKVPSRLKSLEALPRNALGKVTKPDVKRLFA